MTMTRIYYPNELEAGNFCVVTGENRQYVLSVLRMRQGERILLFDGKGHEYEAVIRTQDQASLTVEVLTKETINVGSCKITLAQSLPKGWKMDFIVEKACELGVTSIIPFISSRSVPRLTPEQGRHKQARWQKVALEAARKSHAGGIPEIEEVLSFNEMLCRAAAETVKIIFWEEEKGAHLKQMLHEKNRGQQGDFFLVVGPEGGFSGEEIDLASSRGFASVSLGRQILKVETAALAILSIVQYERGIFDAAVMMKGRP